MERDKHRRGYRRAGYLITIDLLDTYAQLNPPAKQVFKWFLERSRLHSSDKTAVTRDYIAKALDVPVNFVAKGLCDIAKHDILESVLVPKEKGQMGRPRLKYFIDPSIVLKVQDSANIEIQSTFQGPARFSEEGLVEPTIDKQTWKKIDPDEAI